MNKKRIGQWVLLATALLTVIALVMTGPIVQDETYHDFADQRMILGISNFWDVISNLPFVIVSILGFLRLGHLIRDNWLYGVLFFSIGIMGFGSAYYHLAPDTQSLFWDRLPMTFTFMTICAIIISEFISRSLGQKLFVPLLLTGVTSVLLWRLGAAHDLRLYAVVQFYPMIALPVIVLCYESAYTRVNAYWHLLLLYVIAKIFEHLDTEIFALGEIFSGHTLKHFAAGLGVYLLYVGYRKRKRKTT